MDKRTFRVRIRVRRVRLGRRTWKWVLAGFLMLALAENPATESVTLTTYYSSPAGVYNNVVTIGDTWLARDNIPGTGTPSFVELGSNNSLLGSPNTKLDVENGSIRLTNALGGASSDHWIGTDSGGANLALYGKSGGGVDIGTGNVPALSVTSNAGNGNSEILGLNQLSLGSYPTAPIPLQPATYLHVNGSSCNLWGPGDNTCNGANMGADNCKCPAGQYATWVPGIYVETPIPGTWPPTMGWFHPRDEWGVLVYNPTTKQNQYYDVGGSVGSGSISVSIMSNVGQGDSYHAILVPGRNYNLITGAQGSEQDGNQYFYCCPK